MPDKEYLEWPFFNPGHVDLARRIDEWAKDALPAHGDLGASAEIDDACRQIVSALGRDGWLRYCVPGEFGGAFEKLDLRSICLIRETLARHSALADFSFAMQGLGSGAISFFGSQALKEKYLPPVAKGEKIAAFAMSEENAGSDAAAMQTSMTRRGDDFIINGEKLWISNGGIADFYTLFARSATGEDTISALVVDADAPGLTISERMDIIAPHPLARIRFENCETPAARQLGADGEGFKIALATLDVFRTSVGAAALGLARRALDEASARALSRTMFGKTLSNLPITQERIAEMVVDIDASALLVYRSAWAHDEKGKRVTREAAAAKLFATDQAQLVIDKAVQIFGALGVMRGEKVEELYREIRALRIYEGASEIQKIVIARQHFANFAGDKK